MIGLISTLFLCCYAFGQFFVGTLADKVDLRYFLTGAMVMAGLLTVLFGLMGVLQFRELWAYCVVWSLNGFAQACGWPSNLTIMNNWFGKKSRGLIFSAWSSNSNFGSIMAAIICGTIFSLLVTGQSVWETCMITCGILAIIGAIPIFCFLVPDPSCVPEDPMKKLKPVAIVRRISNTRVVPVTAKHATYAEVVEESMERGDRMASMSDELDSAVFSGPPATPPTDSFGSDGSAASIPSRENSSSVSSSSGSADSPINCPDKCPKETEQEDQCRQRTTPNSVSAVAYPDRDRGIVEMSSNRPSDLDISLADPQNDDAFYGKVLGGNDLESGSSSPTSSRSTSLMSSIGIYLTTLYTGLTVRGVVPYMVIYACVKGVVYIFIYWMPFFLISAKTQSNSMAALISSVFDIGAFVGGMLSGYVTDILGSRTAVIIGMILFSTVFTLVLFDDRVTSVAGCLVCLLFIGMSIGGAQVLISASVALDLGDSAINKSVKRMVPAPPTSGMSVTCMTAVNTVTATENDIQDFSQKSAKKLAGTISGMMEGSGSTGAAVLQYVVGELLICRAGEEERDTVTCGWTPILAVIIVGNVLSLGCLMYIKFSSRIAAYCRQK
jgi:sugar phosphate permease